MCLSEIYMPLFIIFSFDIENIKLNFSEKLPVKFLGAIKYWGYDRMLWLQNWPSIMEISLLD